MSCTQVWIGPERGAAAPCTASSTKGCLRAQKDGLAFLLEGVPSLQPPRFPWWECKDRLVMPVRPLREVTNSPDPALPLERPVVWEGILVLQP